jgi:hypothetical protein
MNPYTIDQEIKELKREIGMRYAVYPGQVRAGKMKQVEMDERIGLLESIIERLKKLDQLSKGKQEQLFN